MKKIITARRDLHQTTTKTKTRLLLKLVAVVVVVVVVLPYQAPTVGVGVEAFTTTTQHQYDFKFTPPYNNNNRCRRSLSSLSRLYADALSSVSTEDTTSSASSADADDASSLLYKEQEKLLIDQALKEAMWMKDTWTPLEANVVKGSGGSGGFGGGGGGGSGGPSGGSKKGNKKNKNKKKGSSSSSSKAGMKSQALSHANVLKKDGVVRIDNILKTKQADDIRSQIYKMKESNVKLVESGQFQSIELFANVLLKNNRYDMTIPIPNIDDNDGESNGNENENKWIIDALKSILIDSSIGQTMENLLSEDAILYEWSCLISDPGSERQVIHPDTPYHTAGGEPVLFTCFIALQDITIDMGPTTWIPQTHTSIAHQQFKDDDDNNGEGGENNKKSSGKQLLLETQPSKLGLLPKGSCAIFDSRLLHAGGSNISNNPKKSRALLYVTFKNPNCLNAGNPGSIRKNLIDKYTLQSLQEELLLKR